MWLSARTTCKALLTCCTQTTPAARQMCWKILPTALAESVQRLRTVKVPPSSLTLPGWVTALLYRQHVSDRLCNFPIGSSVHGIKPWCCFQGHLLGNISPHQKTHRQLSQLHTSFSRGWKLPFYRLPPVKMTAQLSPSCPDQFKLFLDSAKPVKGSLWESYAWFI